MFASIFAFVSSSVSAIKCAARGSAYPQAELAKVANKEQLYQFKSQEALLEHLGKHGPDMSIYSPNEFLVAANNVIRNGMYTREMNGYLLLFDTYKNKARFAFVGMDFTHSFITTFGIRGINKLPNISWLIH